MPLAQIGEERDFHPVDIVEQIAAIHEWSFDRSADDEINISVSGSWTDFHLSLNWREDVEALHLACAFDMRVPDARRNEIYRLIAMINEQLWLGHYDLWSHEGVVMFRHGLLLSGGVEPSSEQCAALIENAIETGERYYQAFQFVLWAGKTAEEAIESCLFETAGEA